MKTLVLCVDRDDDFGVKAGLNSPFIGREENLNAAMMLGLKDPEDSDTNTLLAAIGIYDEMTKKGMIAEIATICGDVNVGYESDQVLATQLETALEVVHPDRVILVSDGAEDEYIYPMVSSRIKVDSVRKVFVKQAPTVEGTYYIFIKMMHDDKIRKRILVPIGLALFVFGFFDVLSATLQLYNNPANYGPLGDMGWGTIFVVLGCYLLMFAYKVGERLKDWSKNMSRAIRSGSILIPFVVLTALLVLLGILLGYDSATAVPMQDPLSVTLLFMASALWLWVFAFFTYQIGQLVNHYVAQGEISYSYLVASVTVFAVGFIIQGAIDITQVLFSYNNYNNGLIVLEIVIGVLLTLFGALINSVFRKNQKEKNGPEKVEDSGMMD